MTPSHSMPKTIDLICPVCGKQFRSTQKRIDDGRGKHCSRSCSFKGIPRRKRIPIEEKFWQNVDQSGGPDACWEWQQHLENGYGRTSINRKQIGSHKVAWELVNGPMPEGLIACHTCDNRACCNPLHIYAGTSKDNAQDASRRKRNAHGERNASAVLTADQVAIIRRRLANGERRASLAREYGVAHATIDAIYKGKTWRDVEAA